jgi:hypothetical protein
MSAFSESRFYAGNHVEPVLSQRIESLFNEFIVHQGARTGWTVDLQAKDSERHAVTVTDPDGYAESYDINLGDETKPPPTTVFSDNLMKRYRKYAARHNPPSIMR